MTNGTLTAGVTSIVLDGRYVALARTDATHGILGVRWPGTTGSFPAMSRRVTNDGTNIAAIGTGTEDPDLVYNYACKYNSSTSLTLDRAWHGVSAGGRHMYSNTYAGLGQQPFMLAISATRMGYAKALDAELGINYSGYQNDAVTWVKNYGLDLAGNGGVYYARVCQFCESGGVAAGDNDWATYIIRGGLSLSGRRTARVQNAELSPTLATYAASQAYSAGSITYGDTVYGNLWGQCAYTSGGAPCDAYYPVDENGDNSLAAGKWYGFFFGMGMAHQWPAVRQGGLNGTPRLNGRSVVNGTVQVQ